MNLRFYPFRRPRPGGALTLLAGLSLLASCRHASVTPTPVVDYYPLVVGTYRAYAVTDTTWSAGVATARAFQFREAVTEQFADAAGQAAYRILRSKRLTARDAWVDDSALVVQPLPQAISLTQNNVRTIELIYPLRAGKTWSKYAFTTTRPDSVRAFDPTVGQAFTTPATATTAATAYPAAAIVRDVEPVATNDGLYAQAGGLQIFAQGVGPVLRRSYYYELFTVAGPGAPQVLTNTRQKGSSRLEVLIDSGQL